MSNRYAYKDACFLYVIVFSVCLTSVMKMEATFDPKILKKGYDQVTKGKYLDNVNKTKIGDETETSFVGCIEECLTRRRCSSVNYFKRSRFCHFNFGTGRLSELVSDREDALYTNVSGQIWDPRLVGSCAYHNCDLNQVCMRLPLGKMECTVSDCGMQPTLIANSTYELPDGISLGNRVFYHCNDGYKSNADKRNMFGYCRPNGNWSTPKFKCNLEYCGEPLSVDNAEPVEVKNYSFGMSAYYRCRKNTNMLLRKGEKTHSILCEAGGKWSAPKFICATAVESCDVMIDKYPTYNIAYGPYYITVDNITRPVICNISSGNWTVIQIRNKTESPRGIFNKTFDEYAAGFGNPFNAEHYWIGNIYLAALTNKNRYMYEIYIEIGQKSGSEFGNCGGFVISPAHSSYTLKLLDTDVAHPICNDFKKDNGKMFYGYTKGKCQSFFGRNLCGGWWQGYEMCLNCYLPSGQVKIQQNKDESSGSWSLMMIRKK